MNKTYFLSCDRFLDSTLPFPFWSVGLLSSILPNFIMLKFCIVSRFFRGFSPLQRGKSLCKLENLGINFNVSSFVKQNLTDMLWRRLGGGFLLLLFFIATPLSAQTQLTQSFRFENGVYETFEAFQQNRPTHSGNMIEGNFFINEKTKQAKVEYIRLKITRENLDLDKIWGLVIRGIPYVKASPNLPSHNLKVFASMEVRGNICYYAYDDIEEKELTFKAYNPLIGKPFRTGKAMRKLPVIKEKMLRFTTGEVADFNYENMIKWVTEEEDIVKALRSLGAIQADDKLFDALLLYNDKHLVNFPINQ